MDGLVRLRRRDIGAVLAALGVLSATYGRRKIITLTRDDHLWLQNHLAEIIFDLQAGASLLNQGGHRTVFYPDLPLRSGFDTTVEGVLRRARRGNF